MDLSFIELPYYMEAFLAACRITFWFVLLFGVIAPLFLSHARELPIIEKLIYSWIGLGGIMLVSVMILTMLGLYDLISIGLVLLITPIAVSIWRSDHGLIEWFKQWEHQIVVNHIELIEDGVPKIWQRLKSAVNKQFASVRLKNSRGAIVIIIAAIGGLTRMYPALTNAAPFSRGWFMQLDRIKNLRLQDYFSGYPEPGGMHSLVSLFSMLTQVSPEMILHLLGALSSFFLCILIYWISMEITKNRYPLASIMGVLIYALVPMLFIPISLDQQVEASSIDLALCFALPTLIIYVRNLRKIHPCPWFYVFSGFWAAALTNLFVTLFILFPLMLLAYLVFSPGEQEKSEGRMLGYFVLTSIIALMPFVAGVIYYNIDLESFLLSQSYNIQSFSYYPLLILNIEVLSLVYVAIAVFIVGYFTIRWRHSKQNEPDEAIFLVLFAGISLLYTPVINQILPFNIDVDQLNGFYAILIAVFTSILFTVLLEWIDEIFGFRRRILKGISAGLLVATILSLIYVQGGIRVSRLHPYAVPNGFFEAYYKIIDERQPYSYAIVAPEIQRSIAKNRHFFMDYRFFLDRYMAIDMAYQEQLQVPVAERIDHEVPPASVFIFTENPPYGSIQQGIVYNSPAVMRELKQWLSDYQLGGNRNVEVFFMDETVTVYELVNREEESKISSILFNIYPD